jgi:DNA-binding transcriptional LysR family regulator
MSNPFRLRHRLDAELAKAGRVPDRRAALIETNSSINAQALVRAGLGVALLEPLTAHGAPLAGLVVRPIDTDIPFFFGVITPQSPAPTAQVQGLVGALLQVASALPGFVRHDPTEHARLLHDAPAAKRKRAGTAPRGTGKKGSGR